MISTVDGQPTLLSAFRLAWPASLAAMITPMLGLIDMAVLARAASAADIAGVALAGAVFSILYWTLGFLRMSLSGLTAQADGRHDEARLRAHLIQGLVIGFLLGCLLIIFRGPIASLSEWIMGQGSEASPEALNAMSEYIGIRLLAAPLAIAFFAGVGWLTGQGRTGLMMMVVVTVTFLNAALDALFVLHLDWGVAGIAAGTAIAEALGMVLLGGVILFVLTKRGGIRTHWDFRRLRENLRRILMLNADIALRTFCLALVFAWFAKASGQFGDLTLAANQVLMNLMLTAGLLLDGPAIAAETLVGKALGANQNRRLLFNAAVRQTSLLGLYGALLLTVLLFALEAPILTAIVPPDEDNLALFKEASRFYPWAVLSPLFMLVPFQLDGICIGATRGAALRNSMILSLGLFALGVFFLAPAIGNHGLWISFVLFMLGRGLFLVLGWPGFRPLLR